MKSNRAWKGAAVTVTAIALGMAMTADGGGAMAAQGWNGQEAQRANALEHAQGPQHDLQRSPKRSAASAAIVTVHAGKFIGTLPPLAYGMNTAVWDGNLFSDAVPGRLKQLGVGLLRWPGGSYADQYNWASDPAAFDQFMQLAHAVGATPMLTVNYGSGTPQDAADWVRYVDAHHESALWEIGNEVYGDGEYDHASWETNNHTRKGPAGYGKNALKYIDAMRKVDPRAQIGIVATIPGFWPSGIAPYWDRTLLPIVGKQINFVIIHWYPQNPGQESDAGLLSSTSAIAGYMATLKQYLKEYCGSNAPHVKIFLDETNSVSSNPGKQMMSAVNALFLANDYNTWLENGVANVSWWDLHNSVTSGNVSSTLYGTADYGDYGILSAGDSGEPPLNTPTASFWGYRMQNLFAHPGDRYLAVDSNQAMVNAYAVFKGRTEDSVMLVNTDPAATYSVSVRGVHIAPGTVVTEFSYGGRDPSIETSHPRFGAGVVTIPPYTMVVLDLPTKA